jgi:molybdate transport system substrate-binding protein
VAKPELAPYGAAGVAALKNAGVWNQVQSKMVYAENINMARQYGALRNADAVLTAAALIGNDGGTVVHIDPGLYPPIDQALGIVARAANPAAARKFVDFLLRGKGRDALLRAGYLVR